MGREALIHDWNRHRSPTYRRSRPQFVDETLRDGLQSASVTDPPIDDKLRILHLMERLGIDAADIGIPSAGPRAYHDTLRLAQEIANEGLSIEPHCACRTAISDIELVAQVSQRTGLAVDAYVFIGSSPIRQFAEDWSLDHILRMSEEVIEFARREGVGVAFVTEDTTRSSPQDLQRLFHHALGLGVNRLVLCDTVGHADPGGAQNLVRWTRELADSVREGVQLDWHGHNDRGLAVINAVSAWKAGANRVHGTGLGVGERVGNASIDLLLVNFRLMGVIDNNLDSLMEYAEVISASCNVALPARYPVLGADAFRTATGIHAAAIGKAIAKQDNELADFVYSAVPASWVGKRQEIDIGFMSGRWNVRLWLQQRGIEYSDARCDAILIAAKRANRTLTEADIRAVIASVS